MTATLVGPVETEIELRAREGNPRARGARNHAGKIIGLGTGHALRDAAGENLNAPRPGGEKRERLPVLEIDAIHVHGASHVVLSADIEEPVLSGIEAVDGEEFGRARERGVPEEVFELPAIGAD